MTEAQEKIIDIEDLDIETVRDMLKYMYAGKIENLNTRSPRLLEAADKYQLSELKEICEEMLCDNLTVDTCLECLVLADLHTAEDLKQAAIKFVVDHSEDFVDQVLSSAAVVPLLCCADILLFSQVDKFKSYPDLMALLFKAMAKSPPVKRRK